MPTNVQVARIAQERGAEQPSGVFGTTPGTPVYKDLRLITTDIGGGPELDTEKDASQQFGMTGTENKGKTYRGTAMSKVRVDEIGQMLLYFFGKVTSSDLGGAPAAKQHIYIPLDDLTLVAPSFGMDLAIEKKRMYSYVGSLIDEITISKVGAEEVVITYTIVLKNRTTAAFPTAYAPAYSGKIKLQNVQVATLHGIAVIWESLTIRMVRNWDQTKAFTSSTLPDAEIGDFTVEIDGVVKFENTNPNFIDAYEAVTEGELTIEFRGTLISGANFETLRLEFDRIRINDAPPPQINPDNHKTQSIKAEVLVPTSGDWVKCTVINEDATPATYP